MSNHGWHKSSYSGATNECVEVREHANGADMRDTQHRDLSHLAFSSAAWAAFIRDVKHGAL